MSEPLRPQLGEHAESLIADVLDRREEAIINSVHAKLAGGGTLDGQYAIQQWLAIYEQRTLRRTLIQRARAEKSRVAEKVG